MTFNFDDNLFYYFYFYISPFLIFFLIGILIALVIRNYYNVNLIQKEEEKKFNNFLEKINKEKELVLNNCLREQLDLVEQIRNFNLSVKRNFMDIFNQLKEKENLNEKKIKELEKEIIGYKKICEGKVKQIKRLKNEIETLKKSKGH